MHMPVSLTFIRHSSRCHYVSTAGRAERVNSDSHRTAKESRHLDHNHYLQYAADNLWRLISPVDLPALRLRSSWGLGKTLERRRRRRHGDLQRACLAFLAHTLSFLTTFSRGAISLLTFGGNGLSELHPRHVCYSRGGVLLGGCVLLFFNWVSLIDAVESAWHFLSFGIQGDRDAYWLGVWSVCITSATFASL